MQDANIYTIFSCAKYYTNISDIHRNWQDFTFIQTMNLDLTCKLETPSPSVASLVSVWLKSLGSSKSAVQHGQNVIKKSITATEFPFPRRNDEEAMFLRWQSYSALSSCLVSTRFNGMLLTLNPHAFSWLVFFRSQRMTLPDPNISVSWL